MNLNLKKISSLIAIKASLMATASYASYNEEEELQRVLEQSRIEAEYEENEINKAIQASILEEQSRQLRAEEATRLFLKEEKLKQSNSPSPESVKQTQTSDKPLDFSLFFKNNSQFSNKSLSEPLDFSLFFKNNSQFSNKSFSKPLDFAEYFKDSKFGSKTHNDFSKNKTDFLKEKKRLADLRLKQERSGLSVEDFFKSFEDPSREKEQLKKETMEILGITKEEDFIAYCKELEILEKSCKSSSEISIFKLNLLILGDGKPNGANPLPLEVIENQKKYISNIQKVMEHNNRFQNSKLELQPTSGKDNNCLLYSFIRDDEDLLAKIMEDGDFAKNILFVPEITNGEGILGRDFKIVRKKIFLDIVKNLDRQFDASPLNEFTDAPKITLREVVENIRKNRLDEGYEFLTTEEYLKQIREDSSLLDIGFADIFSVLYKRPTFVFNPIMETIGTETVKTKDSRVIEKDIDISTDKLNLVNGRYLNLANLKGNPIFIHHKGFGGVHYSKLVKID